MKRAAMSRLSGLVLGGLLAASPTIACAEAPESEQAAEQQVDQAKNLGGEGYKSGAVQRAESDVTYAECTSAEAQAPAAVSSPEAQHYAELADQYRGMGASGYKTGLVQRAEANAQRAQARAEAAAAQPAATPATSPETFPPACNSDDPLMQPPDCWK
jgi:hypothetical protein